MSRARYYGKGRHEQPKSPTDTTESSDGRPIRDAVAYARVSTTRQEEEGFSVPAQLDLLREYAAENGYRIVNEFTEAKTAKAEGRSRFNDMLRFLTEHAETCRVILVEKSDRLLRNLEDYGTLKRLMKATALEIHYVKENEVETSQIRSSQKFMRGIRVLQSENYVDNLSEESKKGLRKKAELGLFPQVAPRGYRNVEGPDKVRIIEPHPSDGPIMKRVFERFARGDLSLDDLVDYAWGEGLRTKPSRHSKSGGSKVGKQSLHYCLRNPIYMGEFDYDGKRYMGKHDALVTRHIWDTVQEILDGRKGGHVRRRGKHEHTYSGLVRCGHCNNLLIGEFKKAKRYVYYHCSTTKRRCPERYTPESALEGHYTDVLRSLRFDPELVAFMTEELRRGHADAKRARDEAVGRLKVEIEKVQQKLDAMYDDKLEGRVDLETYDRKRSLWKHEQDRLQREVRQQVASEQTYIESGIELLELAQEAHAQFVTRTPLEKRRLLSFMVSNSVWKDGTLRVSLKEPFQSIALMSAEVQSAKAAGVVSDGLRLTSLPG